MSSQPDSGLKARDEDVIEMVTTVGAVSRVGEWRINNCTIISDLQTAPDLIRTRCASCKHPTRPKYLAAVSFDRGDMFSGNLPGLTPKASTGWVDFFPFHRIRRYSAMAVFNGWMAHCWPNDPVDQASLDAALLMVSLDGNPVEAFLTVKPHSP